MLNFENGRYHYNSSRVLEQIKGETVQLSAGYGIWRPIMPTDGEYCVNLRDSHSGASTTMELSAEDGSPWDDNVDRANPEHVDVRFVDGGDAASSEKGKVDGKFGIGQTANVLITSPFAGKLLLTIETDDVVKTTVLDMKASHMIVPIQITEAMRPNAFVCASVVRPIDPNAKWRTHRASARRGCASIRGIGNFTWRSAPGANGAAAHAGRGAESNRWRRTTRGQRGSHGRGGR